jgi:uncharacterized protein (TIGR00369 family)
MNDFNDDQQCFVCGQKNTLGLRLRFRENAADQTVESEVTFPTFLQGWQDTVHGGMLSTVLDEVMVQAALFAGIKCVSAEITVKFKKPAATGTPYSLIGKVLESRGRVIEAEGQIKDASGTLYAQATGKLFQVKGTR